MFRFTKPSSGQYLLYECRFNVCFKFLYKVKDLALLAEVLIGPMPCVIQYW